MFERWLTGAEVRTQAIRGGAMLYDSIRAGNAQNSWFDPNWWAQRGRVQPSGEGRGAALFIDGDARRLVLRHYRRGGLMARLSVDRYVWRGAAATRSFAEWHLLYSLHRAGLPVPVPIAARYERRGNTYTADLITQQIEAVSSMATRLHAGPLPLTTWVSLGRYLRRFHDAGVFHADLNAHNILIHDDDRVWLIDFDRGHLRRPGLWCDANLVRLRRSIEKITEGLPPEHFSEADWASMLGSYLEAVPVTPLAGF